MICVGCEDDCANCVDILRLKAGFSWLICECQKKEHDKCLSLATSVQDQSIPTTTESGIKSRHGYEDPKQMGPSFGSTQTDTHIRTA